MRVQGRARGCCEHVAVSRCTGVHCAGRHVALPGTALPLHCLVRGDRTGGLRSGL